MRIFFVSHDFSGISLCRRLRAEGHELRVWVAQPGCRAYAGGDLPFARDRNAGVRWAGRDGLVVCDDVGFGAWQDKLRAAGYAVVGGCSEGDRLELDRAYGQQVLAAHGLRTLPTHHFSGAKAAMRHIRKHPAEWVVKLNGNADRTTTYVGELPDGADVLDLLACHQPSPPRPLVLQRRVRGVEIGVARYFNGCDWVGSVEMNVEHKRLFPGDIGPNTPEMGTLMWYEQEAEPRLFQETLGKLKPWLQRVNFRGDIDLNLIVNETGAYPLEVTARFGYPALQLQMEMHRSPWGEFLRALARGHSFALECRAGYGVAILLAVPPFPFVSNSFGLPYRPSQRTHFRASLTSQELTRVHLERASPASVVSDKPNDLLESDGYGLHVTGRGRTISAARRQAYRLVVKLVLPQMYYRRDIGEEFARVGLKQLKQWRYL